MFHEQHGTGRGRRLPWILLAVVLAVSQPELAAASLFGADAPGVADSAPTRAAEHRVDVDRELAALMWNPLASRSQFDILIRTTGPAEETLRSLKAGALLGEGARALEGTTLIASTLGISELTALSRSPHVMALERETVFAVPPLHLEGAQHHPPMSAAHTVAGTTTPVSMAAGLWAAFSVRETDPILEDLRIKLGLSGDGDGNSYSYSVADQVIAIVDTGIDASHRALDGGKVLHHVDFTSRDSSCGPGPETTGEWDDIGHGTFVASVAAGRDGELSGVAPGAAILDLKVFDCRNETDSETVNKALGWILDNADNFNITGVNLSLGSSGNGDGTGSTARLVNQIQAAGMHVTVAAGNSGPQTGTLYRPADAEHVVTVGAMSAGPRGTWIAGFSSRGPTSDGREGIDVLAPGVNMIGATAGEASGWGEYMTGSGTSMSAPWMAGLLALMREAAPDVKPWGIACPANEASQDCSDGVQDASMVDPSADIARATAQDWWESGLDSDSGAGALRSAIALARAARAEESRDYSGAQYISARVSPDEYLAIAVRPSARATGIMVRTDTPRDMFVDDPARVNAVMPDGGYLATRLGSFTSGGSTMSNSVGFFGAEPMRSHWLPRLPEVDVAWLLIHPPYNQGNSSTLSATVAGEVITTMKVPISLSSSDLKEGSGPGTLSVAWTGPRAADVRYRLTGGKQIAAIGDVDLSGVDPGTTRRVRIEAVDDSVSEGRHTGTVTLIANAGSLLPPISLSVPIDDDERGPVAQRRVLIEGQEIPPGVQAQISPVRMSLSPVLGSDRGHIFGTFSGARWADGYSSVGYAPPDGDLRPVGLRPDGTAVSCSTEALGMTPSGSHLLVGVLPLCATQVFPEAVESTYTLVVKNTATGELQYGGPRDEELKASSWSDTLALRMAGISADGSKVAYFWTGTEGPGLYVRSLETGQVRLVAPARDVSRLIMAGNVVTFSSKDPRYGAGSGAAILAVDLAVETPVVELLNVDSSGAWVESADLWAVNATGRYVLLGGTRRLIVRDRQRSESRQLSNVVQGLSPGYSGAELPTEDITWLGPDGRTLTIDPNRRAELGDTVLSTLLWDERSGIARSLVDSAAPSRRIRLSPAGTMAIGLDAVMWPTESYPPSADGDTNGGVDIHVGQAVARDIRRPGVVRPTASWIGSQVHISWPRVAGAQSYQFRNAFASGSGGWVDIGNVTELALEFPGNFRESPGSIRAVGALTGPETTVSWDTLAVPPVITHMEALAGELLVQFTNATPSPEDWAVEISGDGGEWRPAQLRSLPQPCANNSQACPGLMMNVMGLKAGFTYRVRVAQRGPDSRGTWGYSDRVTLGEGFSVPGPPTGVRAIPGNGSVQVTWRAPAADGGSPVAGYTVTSSPGERTCMTKEELTCVVTGLVNGTFYTFSVIASNAAGASSPSMPSSSVAPQPPLVVPDVVRNLKATALKGAVRVTWSPPANMGGVTSLTYQYRLPGQSWRRTQKAFVIIPGERGSLVRIRVRALNQSVAGRELTAMARVR